MIFLFSICLFEFFPLCFIHVVSENEAIYKVFGLRVFLGTNFGVSLYLKVMDRILASMLPTARNVSEEIAACQTKEEFKRIVP